MLWQDTAQRSNLHWPSVVEVLQKRVLEAESAVRKQEQEKTALKVQVEQYESRLLEYQAKMRAMEEMWERKIASLQVCLNALILICSCNIPNYEIVLLAFQHVHSKKYCECESKT